MGVNNPDVAIVFDATGLPIKGQKGGTNVEDSIDLKDKARTYFIPNAHRTKITDFVKGFRFRITSFRGGSGPRFVP